MKKSSYTLESMVNLDSSLIDTVYKALSVSVYKDILEDEGKSFTACVSIANSFHTYEFFTEQVLARLQDTVLSQAPIRDFLYSTLSLIKFALAAKDIPYDKLLSTVAAVGSHDLTPSTHASAQQKLINQAYSSISEERVRYLIASEWAITLLLLNIFSLDMLSFLSQQ